MKNRWIFAIIAATIIGAVSGLYDKYLLKNYDRMAVQAWFSIYMIIVLFPFLIKLWYPQRKKLNPFKWRYSIPAIGVFLSVADFFISMH